MKILTWEEIPKGLQKNCVDFAEIYSLTKDARPQVALQFARHIMAAMEEHIEEIRQASWHEGYDYGYNAGKIDYDEYGR